MFLLCVAKKVPKNLGDGFIMSKFAAIIKERGDSDVNASGFFSFLRFNK